MPRGQSHVTSEGIAYSQNHIISKLNLFWVFKKMLSVILMIINYWTGIEIFNQGMDTEDDSVNDKKEG